MGRGMKKDGIFVTKKRERMLAVLISAVSYPASHSQTRPDPVLSPNIGVEATGQPGKCLTLRRMTLEEIVSGKIPA